MSAGKYIAALVGTGCVVAALYFLFSHRTQMSFAPASNTAITTSTSTPTDTPVSVQRAAPGGALAYQNNTYHFSLFYPNNLSVKVYDEGGGASTVTFQDVSTAQGFQIFIVPYTASQISTTRFKEDEPSGVMQGPLNVTVGGVPATSFYSTNALLGDTAEVWLLRGGYLYEVTAPKSEAAWLSQIMGTWEFI